MTINFVPREIFIRHENEWQAVREAADERINDERINIGKRQKPLSAIGGTASVGKNDPSATGAERPTAE
ncbi:hypothetical protein [Rhizobium laguerreae]|uniref:hypothetical protein n=1 Tax=Rhizobium laguerreae TaxID=1076926 RepID=UPI00143F3B4A|nr:hypothetical protein [Rhizobium laguerreae]MBY3277487.1 hypothetical protein [Rhizobium laguerreae]NKM11288.1 hypothetical protein [Rhizobium laguerreae]NKM39496.1 hypothetical protein [Rhizobium laguerreae]